MIEAILFDLDNTLLDFMSVKKKAVDAAIIAMIEAGLDIKVDIARKNIFKIYDDKGYEYQEVFDDFLIKFHGSLDYVHTNILNFDIELYGRDTFSGASYFEVHVSRMILKAHNVGHRHEFATLFSNQADRYTGHQ